MYPPTTPTNYFKLFRRQCRYIRIKKGKLETERKEKFIRVRQRRIIVHSEKDTAATQSATQFLVEFLSKA